MYLLLQTRNGIRYALGETGWAVILDYIVYRKGVFVISLQPFLYTTGNDTWNLFSMFSISRLQAITSMARGKETSYSLRFFLIVVLETLE